MSTIELASPEKKDIREFFDAIASRYDLINTLLSFRLDERWRKKSCGILLEDRGTAILDIGTGTGKYLDLFLQRKKWDVACGIDFSSSMLQQAKRNLPQSVNFVNADLHDLPFSDQSFDLVISSFTLRSVKDVDQFLGQVYRVLKPGGKASFLCLTRPQKAFFRAMYYPYLRYYLPLAGHLFSGQQKAYQFLAESIQHFQDPAETMKVMAVRGFHGIEKHVFSLGAATLITGRK